VRSIVLWSGAACGLLCAGQSLAQQTEPIRLAYHAAAGCPGRESFIAQVQARTPRARFTGDEAAGQLVVVSAEVLDGRARGTIGTGSGRPREVSADNCADVITALALIAALTVDPNAISTSTLPSPAKAPPSATPPAQPPPERSAPAERRARWSPDWFFGTGGRFDASTGIGVAESIKLLGGSTWIESGARMVGILVPSVRVSGRYASSPTVSAGGGAAHFRLLVARLDASPVRFEFGPAALVPYLALEFGELRGRAEAAGPITTARNQGRTWWCAAEGLALEVELREPFHLTLYGELRQPLARYRFVFEDPDLDVAEVPKQELGAGLGVGARFW
jgi:hypothetical protein